MFSYRKRFLRIAQLWFEDPPPTRGVDVAVFNQATCPWPGIKWAEKMTIILDLKKSEETLLGEMKKADRAKIRNALHKESIFCDIIELPDYATRRKFYDFYDEFATTKNLPTLDRILMEAMAGQGALVLSFAQEGPGGLAPNPLVLHATYVHGARVRALYSCSSRLQEEDPERRTLIGQANRRLHWQDICWFKARGAEIYDFGGWYSGTEDAQRLAINRFKECYGGQRVTEYEAMVGVSLLGKSAVAVRRLLKGGG